MPCHPGTPRKRTAVGIDTMCRNGMPRSTPLQLALARGYRWQAMLESGEAKSLKEIAARMVEHARKGILYFGRGVDHTCQCLHEVAGLVEKVCVLWET